ncbi:hypothetical protein Gotur_007838 [Gossypium turneri]
MALVYGEDSWKLNGFEINDFAHHVCYAPNFTFSSKFDLWDANTDCCSWEGVTCDAYGHVVGIDLSYKNLSGGFHSIFDLHHLQHLNLAGNNFNTTLFSYGFDKLQNLTHLNLSSSCFHGQIPMQISHLTRLVSLNLSYQGDCYLRNGYGYNSATLKLENPNFMTLIKNLRFLTDLYLDETLYLGENQLVGKIDEFPNASSSSIERLFIGNNYLTGPIPKSILQLPRLEWLYVEGNSFSSMKLDMFVQVKNLRHLTLFNTSLLIESDSRSLPFPQLERLTLRSCNLTEFPEFIKRQDKLVDLDLSNSHIHGFVPNWLWKSSLSSVDLSFNVIDFPKQLPLNDANFSFPMLKELRLRSCNISAFPEFVKAQDKLVDLDLSNNHIHGVVPNWLWKSSRVNLSFNVIDFPKQLDLNFSFSMLRELYLESCNISSFPESLKSQENLEYLELSNNKISGAIPNWVWKKSLRYLVLANNNLSSPIPNWLCNMSQLSGFDASYNNLSGSIPNCSGNMSQLLSFDVSYNNLRGPIPNCLGNMSALTWLGLQGNNFSGMIPKFSKATQLQFLKVSENRLEGKLPRY